MKINRLIFCFSVIKKIVLLNTFIQENARMQFKCRWFNLSMMISISNSIIIALYHKDQWKQWWKKYKKCIANINAISAQRFHLFNKMIMKILSIEVWQSYNWQQRPIKEYDISNRLTSYRAQSYDQNKLSFDSIASQMTASQVKNRNFSRSWRSKSTTKREFINAEERIINSDSNLIDKLKSKLTWKEQVINRLQNSTEDCVLTQKSKSNSFALEDCTKNNVVSEKYSISYQITICFTFSWCARQ